MDGRCTGSQKVGALHTTAHCIMLQRTKLVSN